MLCIDFSCGSVYATGYVSMHLAASHVVAPTLRDKRLHPHSLRHTTAIHLLKAVVDFATISH